MSQHQKYVDDLEAESRNSEEVHRYQVLHVVLQKSAPSLRWRLPVTDHILAHTGGAPLFAVSRGPFFAVAAQQSATSDVDTMLRQARDEIRDFEKAGGKKDDPSHPISKWVKALWALREKSPSTVDTATATSEAVHLLIHADRFQEAQARTD